MIIPAWVLKSQLHGGAYGIGVRHQQSKHVAITNHTLFFFLPSLKDLNSFGHFDRSGSL